MHEHFLALGFWAQTIRQDQLDDYIGKGFAVITRDEMDLPARDGREYGLPVGNALTKGPDIWVKIPKILKDRMDKRYIARAKREREFIQPSKELLEQARREGFPVEYDLSRKNYGELEDAVKGVKR